MFDEVKDCQRVTIENFSKPLRLTLNEGKDFQNATKCHICDRYKTDETENIPVRDHCYITEKYRGSVHRAALFIRCRRTSSLESMSKIFTASEDI